MVIIEFQDSSSLIVLKNLKLSLTLKLWQITTCFSVKDYLWIANKNGY